MFIKVFRINQKVYISLSISLLNTWNFRGINNLWHCPYKSKERNKKNFTIFTKVRKYTKDTDKLEEYLTKKESTPIRNQLILVKDFYKLVKEKTQKNGLVMFNETNPTIRTNFKIKN